MKNNIKNNKNKGFFTPMLFVFILLSVIAVIAGIYVQNNMSKTNTLKASINKDDLEYIQDVEPIQYTEPINKDDLEYILDVETEQEQEKTETGIGNINQMISEIADIDNDGTNNVSDENADKTTEKITEISKDIEEASELVTISCYHVWKTESEMDEKGNEYMYNDCLICGESYLVEIVSHN